MKSNPAPFWTRAAIFFACLAFNPVSFTQAAEDEPADASGVWEWSYTASNGQAYPSSVELRQEGQKLTGTYHGAQGGDTPIENGKVSGRRVSFSVARQWQDREFTLEFTGELEGDQIKGRVGFGESDRSFDWTATRKPQVDVAGVWKWTVNRRGGESSEQTLTLKRADGTLQGTLETGRGETEIEDVELDGDRLAFTVSRELPDNRKFSIRYSGAVKETTIEGTAAFEFGGQTRSRDWTARRSSPAADVNGAWAWTLALPEGRTMEATLRLRQTDAELTGALQGDDWELPLTEASIEGDQIRFVVTRQTDEGEVVYTSTGVVEGDTVQGKVENLDRYGIRQTRSWSAKKKN